MNHPNAHIHVGMQGRFKLDVLGPDKRIRRSTGWFNNLILTNGMDLIGSTGGVLAYCHVGVGNTPPTSTQTNLVSFVAATGGVVASSASAQSSAPYYGSLIKTWQFTPAILGNVAHNFSEVGVGATNLNNGNLFSRQLILDGSGNPTTITVLGDEYLNVTYELRYYAPASDVVGSVIVNGTTYSTTVRAARVTNASYWASDSSVGAVIGSKAGFFIAAASSWFDGAIQPVTSLPSGTQMTALSTSVSNYVNGNYYVDLTINSVINTAYSGMQSFYTSTTLGALQIGFSPSISKTNTQQLTFVVRVSWGIHPLP